MKPNHSANAGAPPQSQRLDTWLWASRFYKTRKIAADAVKAGHIWINGQRGKPAKPVRLADRLKIRRHFQEYIVIVSGLSDKRLGAPLAAALYQETAESQLLREQKQQILQNQRAGLRYDRTRPNKRDRQKMMHVKYQLLQSAPDEPGWDEQE